MRTRLLLLGSLLVLAACAAIPALGQFTGTINTYARVTAITANSPAAGQTTLTIDNVGGRGTFTAFSNADAYGFGTRVLIIQMRGATANTTDINTATYGDLSAINNAGNYEYAEVLSSTATTVVINKLLTRTYTPGTPGGAVQVVHVPIRSTGTATVTGTLTCPNFSATTGTGGIIALVATNTLELQANISANGAGFAGGAVSTNGGAAPCDNTPYAGVAGVERGGKGSGISIFNTNPSGRGRWINGGGGGNEFNAGGGGGSNYTAGGQGGNGIAGQTNCDIGLPSEGGRGLGGAALDYSTGRIYMGGGGGGGQQDANEGGAGAAGGGIIILSAGTLTITASRTISANGNTGGSTTADGGATDGAGGGGGGGTILLEVGTYSLPGSPGCANLLTVTANGGNGGNANGADGTTRGHGGGGGAGYIGVTNTATSGQCIAFASNPGNPGVSCSGGTGCPTTINPGGSTGGLPPGCMTPPCTTPVGPIISPLPIVLTSLTGQRQGADILLSWATASELNNSHFVVERSGDGLSYAFLTTVPGNGTTQRAQRYAYADREAPTGDLYYRLLQIDFDGTQTIYGPIRVTAESGEPSLRVVQNPVRAGQPVAVEVSGSAGRRLELVDLNGRVLAYQWVSAAGTTLVPLYAHDLTTGLYIVRLQGTRLSARVVVE